MVLKLPVNVSAPLSDAQKSTIRNLVRRAARTEILPRFRRLAPSDIDQKSGPLDLVTQADIAAEAMITRGLHRAFPSAWIVGEEAVAADPARLERIGEEELSFLVDPVDGTWNYAHGLPLFGTIIAACRFGRPVYGLIYDPLTDDCMEGDLDSAAMQRSGVGAARRIHTARAKSCADALGYAHMTLMPEAQKAVIGRIMPQLRGISYLRCSAHEYRLLAQGAVDFVLSPRMTPWDHAAGVLLCQKAGGHSAMLDGSEYTAMAQGYLLSASSEAMWQDLAALFGDLKGPGGGTG